LHKTLLKKKQYGKIQLSLCTAYQSTVQTEQAMNLDTSSWGWARWAAGDDIQYLWDSKMFYRYFYISFKTIMEASV